MKNPPVAEIMTRDPISISPDLDVAVALELMGNHSCRRLPVISETGHLVGIITLAEAQRAMPGTMLDDHGFPRADMPKVRDVMTSNVYRLAPTDPISVAARRMVNQRIGAMPVLDGGKLVGIITESDIFRFLAAQYESEEAAA